MTVISLVKRYSVVGIAVFFLNVQADEKVASPPNGDSEEGAISPNELQSLIEEVQESGNIPPDVPLVHWEKLLGDLDAYSGKFFYIRGFLDSSRPENGEVPVIRIYKGADFKKVSDLSSSVRLELTKRTLEESGQLRKWGAFDGKFVEVLGKFRVSATAPEGSEVGMFGEPVRIRFIGPAAGSDRLSFVETVNPQWPSE